jgi:hypothetical protein
VVVAVEGTAQAQAAQNSRPAEVRKALRLDPGEWTDLFDGTTLSGWKITDFAGHGEVEVRNGQLVVEAGAALSGVTFIHEPPRLDYEVSLEAMKLSGSDFFCGLTVPYANTNFSLILGGWGGGVVGISSIDGGDASSNETTKFMSFEANRWYRIRLRVTPPRLEAWLDDKPIVNVEVKDRRVGMRFGEIEIAVPLSLSTYQTTAAYRNIRLRTLVPPK